MQLKVGAGKVCINPSPDMYPLPLPKGSDWGLAPSSPECPYDDMNCRAIVIDNGTERFVFVSFELGMIPKYEELYPAVAEAAGVPVGNILMSATHNHTGYMTELHPARYDDSPENRAFVAKVRKIVVNGAVSAVKKAVETMRPAKYGYGETESYCNTNRDLKTLGGYWVEGRNLAGYSDKTVAIIKFVDEDNKLIAALMNYGCHATCCYLMKDFDGKSKTSGNFTGIASRFVEDHYGGDAVAMWTPGPNGDQNPLLSHGLQYEYADGWTSAVDYPNGVGFMQMELMGRTHGADCVRGLDSITAVSKNMPIRHTAKEVELPTQKQAGTDGFTFNFSAFRMGGRGVRDYSEYPQGQIPPVPSGPAMEDNPEHPAILKMRLIMLGDIAIVCVNGELYAKAGMELKAASPYRKTFIMGHTNPVDNSYILDKNAAEQGAKGFQAFQKVKPGASDDVILAGQMAMFDDILDK